MVKKYEVIIEDGGHWWGWLKIGNPRISEYRGYTALIEANNFRPEELAIIKWKGLHADWVTAVDKQLELETKLANSDVPIEESELTKLTKRLDDIQNNSTKPLETKKKELQETIDKIVEESDKKIEAINQQVEKQNEEHTKVLKALQKAKDDKDTAREAILTRLLRQGEEEMAKTNNQKKNLPKREEIMELLAAHNKSWWEKINYKSPRLYGAVVGSILIIILIWWMIKKAIGSWISRN